MVLCHDRIMRLWRPNRYRNFGRQNQTDPTTCAANTRTAKEVWSCRRDEGRPLGAGDQEQASNHCELLPLRAVVVSVAGKGGTRSRQVRSGETSASEPLMTCRNSQDGVETRGKVVAPGMSSGGALNLARAAPGLEAA